MDSRIPLIQHSPDWMDAELSNILDYPAVPILTQVLTSNVLFENLGTFFICSS